MEQRFAFNEVAEIYAKARADYPEALFDDIVAAAGLTSADRILELGCGTDKATGGFGRTGCRILALDPGAELIRVARENLAAVSNIAFITSTFEAWPPELASFKLVLAAQSLH